MTTMQHRCVTSGRTVALEARYLSDAEEWRTRHECPAPMCVQYHEVNA